MGSSDASAGPDGVALASFRQHWRSHREQIREELLSGSYKFQGYRGHPVRKKSSDRNSRELADWRPISVASIRDRVVQRAILDVIWTDIRDSVFNESSFGGIRCYYDRGRWKNREDNPSLGLNEAVERIVDLRRKGFTWLFETDIKSFFPSINREVLLSKLAPLLRDDSLNSLIESVLDTSIQNLEALGFLSQLWNPTCGVPQGGVLSPTLANLYLGEFDREIVRRGFQMVRYMDDLVILTTSESETWRAYESVMELVANLGLSIHGIEDHTKTHIRSPTDPFTFLGLSFTSSSIKPAKKKFDELKERLEWITSIRRDFSLTEVITNINWCLQGWINAYKRCNLYVDDLRRIDGLVENLLRGLLVRREIVRRPEAIPKRSFDWLGVLSTTDILGADSDPWLFFDRDIPSRASSASAGHSLSF